MNNRKATKRALLTSVMALALCVVMLVGTTFAWFTDTAKTSVNKIQAGNLKMEVAYRTSLDDEWLPLDEASDLFGGEGALYEPGYTRVVEFKIKNAGNLAFKYKVGMNVVSETAGVNKDEKAYKLSDYLKVGTTAMQGYPAEGTIAEMMERLIFERVDYGMWTAHDFANFELEKAANGNVHYLMPDKEMIFGMKVYMPTSVGNEANAISSDKAASIDFGISVVATQYTMERDSIDNKYDKNATYPVADYTALQKAFEGSGVYNVTENVDVKDTLTLTGFNALTLDATGKIVSNEEDLWSESAGSWSLISARNSSMLTIAGGDFKAKENDCYAVDVQNGATVTIEDGTFIGNIHAVYVQQGTANIKGGFFSVQQKYPEAAKANEFVLNCYDANRANGTAKIIVTGGTFVNFNPANCYAEGANTNFVADGYKVVSETQTNGDIWYTVIPE